ncbi:hypothetical protein INT48_003668, partial [Thamnidium elegans]
YLLENIPENHWLTRYPAFPPGDFFLFDSRVNRLRIRVQDEFITRPQLCKRLFKDIIIHRTVRLKQYLWTFITTDQTDNDSNDNSEQNLIAQFRALPLWSQFSASVYRQISKGSIYKNRLSVITQSSFDTFWIAPMLTQGRSLWYRILNQKLPTNQYLSQIGTVNSPSCRLCGHLTDDFDHFLFFCKSKQTVWLSVMDTYFSEIDLSLDDIYHTLISLAKPTKLSILKYNRYLTILSTTQWCIWSYYWRFILSAVPFNPISIIKLIDLHCNILLRTHHLLTDL